MLNNSIVQNREKEKTLKTGKNRFFCKTVWMSN